MAILGMNLAELKSNAFKELAAQSLTPFVQSTIMQHRIMQDKVEKQKNNVSTVKQCMYANIRAKQCLSFK